MTLVHMVLEQSQVLERLGAGGTEVRLACCNMPVQEVPLQMPLQDTSTEHAVVSALELGQLVGHQVADVVRGVNLVIVI